MPTSTDLGAIRAYVLDVLRPLVPDTWRLEDGIPTLGTLDQPILWLEYSSFSPLDGTNPNALAVAARVDICIASNLRDMRTGEAEADDMAADLFYALVASRQLYDLGADKTVWAEAYVGWRIRSTIHTNAIEETP